MTLIEQEILSRIQQLTEAQQQRVLEFLETLQPATFDFAGWMQDVEAFQEHLRASYGPDYSVGSQSLLDEIREESSWLKS